MKKKARIKNAVPIAFLLLLLAGSGIACFHFWQGYELQRTEAQELEELLRQAEVKEKENLITQRISSQMEEIAYQQKEISDQQRQEAVHQTIIADQMRRHAEEEREKAIRAGEAAIESYNQMEEQKRIAELRREEAIAAQMRADTLAKLSLGRSLASEAITQYNTGNRELARLLALASWTFTERYGGDVYQSNVFDALTTVSSLSRQWRMHRSAVRDLLMYNNEGDTTTYLLSASQYGEVYLWKPERNSILMQRRFVENSQLDFRKLLRNPDNGDIYALDYNGQLYVIPAANIQDSAKKKASEGQPYTVVDTQLAACFSMAYFNQALYVASRDAGIYRVDTGNGTIALFYKHPTPISALAIYKELLLFGDTKGHIFALNSEGNIYRFDGYRTEAVSFMGTNHGDNPLIIGYKDGKLRTIRKSNIVNPRMDRRKLAVLNTQLNEEYVGHVSSITQIDFIDKKLISCSYDGYVRLWDADAESKKVSSSVIYRSPSWIHALAIDETNEQIYTGDESGSLAVISISPQQMAAAIQKQLTRDFTKEEWAYYIGELSEYEQFRKGDTK